MGPTLDRGLFYIPLADDGIYRLATMGLNMHCTRIDYEGNTVKSLIVATFLIKVATLLIVVAPQLWRTVPYIFSA